MNKQGFSCAFGQKRGRLPVYNLAAVQRLHMIKALAQTGLELATVGLSRPGRVLAVRICWSNRSPRPINNTRSLNAAPALLRENWTAGGQSLTRVWVQTLELMKCTIAGLVSRNYRCLPFAEQDGQRNQTWLELVGKRQSWANACPAG